MKYLFDKKIIKTKYRPYLILNIAICIILTIVNRLYNTLGNSSILAVPLILILLISIICLSILFFIRHVEIKTYKNSYLSLHKGKIKYRINNMQNFWSEYNEYPEYKQYKIVPESIDVNNKYIIVHGKIELSLVNENEYSEKSKLINSVKIPAYYNDWQKVLDKITNSANV